jgi:hypothetical protein
VDSSGECTCSTGSALYEKDPYGQYLSVKSCTPCTNGTYPGGKGIVYECKSCPEGMIYDKNNAGNCICDTNYVAAGGICLPSSKISLITQQYPLQNAKQIIFGNKETIDPKVDDSANAASDTIDYLYIKAADACLYNADIQQCHVLANLCVMQLYDPQNAICKLYKYINGLKPNVPNAVE